MPLPWLSPVSSPLCSDCVAMEAYHLKKGLARADGARVPVIVELVGLGAVGRRLLSELLSTRSVELVRVRSRRVDVAAAQVGGLARVEVVGEGRRADADWMAVTTEAGAQRSALRLAADAGIPAVSVCDDPDLVTELLEGWAAPVVVGATFSPGLTDVMAVHAAGLLDEVTELHVARHLSGSRSCAEARARALKREGRDWRDGAWLERAAGSGRELWFFPSPWTVRIRIGPIWPRCTHFGPPTRRSLV